MKHFFRFLLFFLITFQLDAIVTVANFPQTVTAKVLDRATGNFYVGLGAHAGANAVSVANRPDYGASSSFRGIAANTVIDNNAISFLTLATSTGNLNPNLAVVIAPQTGVLAQVVNSLNANGTQSAMSAYLLDGSGIAGQNGTRTSGIVGLAANQNFMFPAVQPCGGSFGTNCNGGIASVAIDQTTLALAQVPAIPGDGGVKAQKIDPTTPAIYINNSPTITPDKVDLNWDDQLQRLYIGIEVTTAGSSSIGASCPIGTGTCATGPNPSCSQGLYFNEASATCATCPTAGIFDAASQMCQLCPTGTLFNIAAGQCITATCPFAQFFNPDPTQLTCITCPDGWTFNTSSLTCVTCPNGGIYDPTIPGCTPCPTGYVFAPALGMCVVQSVSCPTGFSFCPQTQGCVVSLSCPAGSVFDPSQSCTQCVLQSAASGPSSPFTPLVPFTDQQSGVGDLTFLGFNGILRNQEDETFDATRGPQRNPAFRLLTPSGARSVVVGQVDATGAITLVPIAPDTAFVSGDPQNRIIGALDVIPHTLTVNKVRVMHASTGPSYLIINGGDNNFGQTNNTIYALPLVDLGDPTNSTQGTLADVTSALVNFKFVTPALLNSQMPSATQPAVQVGDGPLNLLPFTAISDIDVIQDTVYVSINHAPSTNNDGGILYSQAMFDETGKIIRWTPWTKKAFPPFSQSSTFSSAAKFFSVDAVVAKLWVVDGSGTNVLQNSWTNTGPTPIALLPQLNAIFGGAAIAVLDLDQSTTGFLANTARYALFSGGRNVVFTLVSKSTGGSLNSAQLVTTDFTNPANFLVTTLPSDSCQVMVLEYSRQLTGRPNYFFAGSRTGLYVFSDSGNGFDVATMGNLNLPPFSNGSWQAAPNISGPVADIKTTGNALYVLMANGVAQSTLYLIPFQPTVAAMFSPGNIFTIAQSGVGIFANIAIFNGLQIISTMPDGSTEQIVLATNNGLYESTKPGGVQVATSQTDAAWILKPGSNFYYNGIAKIDNASIPTSSPSTVWPFYIADTNNQRLFDRSIWQQLNGTSDGGPFNFVPPFFNSIETNNYAFSNLPLISYFWSDGARRIGIVSNVVASCAPGQLMCLPFDTLEWDIDNPEETILSDPFLNKTNAFYWVKQIGVTGLLMAGTDKGIVALA